MLFRSLLGFGRRNDDYMPYRAVGPVTVTEYESRADRYDTQLRDIVGIDPEGMSTEEKVAALRMYREEQYDKTLDVVYRRRGWDNDGIPTVERLRELGIDLPELVKIVEEARTNR